MLGARNLRAIAYLRRDPAAAAGNSRVLSALTSVIWKYVRFREGMGGIAGFARRAPPPIYPCGTAKGKSSVIRAAILESGGLLNAELIQSALAPRSPVRIRTTSSIGKTKILPSPIRP